MAFIWKLKSNKNFLVMKTLRLAGMALFAILMCLDFTSCSNENETLVNDEEVYIVKLGWGGEILDITDEPLSRATTNNLYGVQVYSTPDKELAEGEEKVWTPYAYGLFDDPVGISVNLFKGYKYKFVATMLVDGKNKLYSENNIYFNPFVVTSKGGGTLSNKFNYTALGQMALLDEGKTHLPGFNGKHPNIDRYYGELIDFVPNSNNSASIPMKRASFGATFIAQNTISKDGKLEIQLKDAPKMEIEFTEGESNEFKAQDIFTFDDVDGAYAKDDYTETIPVTFNWHRADGATIPLGTHDITYKRNRNTIVTILIKIGGSESELGFSIDASEQTDINNMTEDGNKTIEG